jgi:hypothetical protein
MSRAPHVLILIFAAVAAALLGGTTAQAQILHEQGKLRGFLGGNCPGCGYDNWITHISEGVARPGYNDYGPLSLDPQMNGFGQYLPIPDSDFGDSLIADWYRISSALFQGDTVHVESLLVATQLDSLYDFAILHDSTRVYYLLREQLNLAYYDTQATAADSSDDVRGSFDAGWGMYVFSPSALRPNILIEAPHPEDDFITPYISTDVFQLFDAGVLMIAGAGREVLWTHEGEYDNSKSLSDPSRIEQTFFQAAHRAFADLHLDDFTLQLHSFDSAPHLGLKSLVISAGPDDGWPNEPIMDRCAHDDMISLTPPIAVPANTAGHHPAVAVTNYYCVFYEGGYRYHGTGPLIVPTWDLMGYGQNRQILYSHIGHDGYRNTENIVHIEMDEMPDVISDSVTVYYETDLPGVVTFANFQHALDYFRPAYQALLQALPLQPMFARVAPTPTSVNFGDLVIPDSASRTVAFQNILPDETIHVSGAFTSNSVFTLTNAPADIFLSPGQVCSLSVHFRPVDAITYYAALTLSTDSGCSSIGLQGSGLAPLAISSPDSVNFDTVELGVPDTISVLLRNPGYMDLNIYGFISCGLNARFLAPPDSLIPARTDDTLRIQFTPQSLVALTCSVAVVSNAFNADTAWVTVVGVGTATPLSVLGLTAHRSGNNMVLRWPPVTHTTRGLPLAANGYIVLAQSSLSDSVEVLADISDTIYTDFNAVPSHERRFYHVIAYYMYSPACPPTLRPEHREPAGAAIASPLHRE